MERKIAIDKEYYIRLRGEVSSEQTDEEIIDTLEGYDKDLTKVIRKEITDGIDVSVSPIKKKGMIYTKMTKKALQLCFLAHRNQLDKGNMPYVFHPYHLAEQMTSEKSVTVALLHDVVEDTDTTLNDLRGHGFPEDVVEAVKLLTHSKIRMTDSEYEEYIMAISKNPIAREVKLADLIHNSDLSRLPIQKCTEEKALLRVERYKRAIEMLSETADKDCATNKLGRWLKRESNERAYHVHCSECDPKLSKTGYKNAMKYCPDCGQRMIEWRSFDANS